MNPRLRWGPRRLIRKWGEQFRIESFVTVKPATLAGIEKYLGSGLVPGIGRVMAERMVQHFGLATLDVIEKEPQRLQEVEGIGACGRPQSSPPGTRGARCAG